MINKLKAQLALACPELELREAEPMARHTSFRIGGPAALMALPNTQEQAALALQLAAQLQVRPFFLGKGSNLLVSDEGLDGFVLKYSGESEGLTREGDMLCASSALSLAHLAVFAMEQGLTGLEFAHGIPGTLGGAIFMNAGAYEGEMAQCVREVTCLTLHGEQQTISAADCDFSYRHSAFYKEERLILSAQLMLTPADREEIFARMRVLMEQRRQKQPLEFPSAGSSFKRPEGQFAGALIEAAGLKGFAVGAAQISEKHAGFVINRGGATCMDVVRLMQEVKRRVFDRTGVLLEPEIRLLGATWDVEESLR